MSILWRSAYQVGDSLSLAQVLRAQNAWLVTANSLNISLASGTPLSTIQAAAKVGKDVAVCLFDKRAQPLRLESKRGSLRSVASGLKAWHDFAEQVLDYPCTATLPPRTDADIRRFISVCQSRHVDPQRPQSGTSATPWWPCPC